MAYTTPRTWVAGEVVTAALLNTHLRDNMKALGDAWEAYTPTMTGAGTTQGNAVMSGGYRVRGKTVDFWAKAVIGTGSAIGSNVTLSLPVNARAAQDGWAGITAQFGDTGVGNYLAGVLTSTTGVRVVVPGTNGFLSGTSATVPFTWGAGDVIYVGGTYEAA